MSKGLKVLISGLAASGKTTITGQIENALVINLDEKPYTQTVKGVATMQEYKGMDDLISWINSKVVAYKNKYGELPKYIVFDTITRLYTTLVNYNGDKHKGFDSHRQNLQDTYAINKYFNLLSSKGINVICVAHANLDRETGKINIPAQGAFKDNEGWLALFDEAIYMGIDKGKRIIAVSDPLKKFPCRKVGCKEAVIIPEDQFDINQYLTEIKNSLVEISEFEL